jgi:uncharacterized membrane protein YgdD (TMEM256/DUF423 family)
MHWPRFLLIAAITPIGGLGFILGWVGVVVTGWRSVAIQR